MILIFCVVFAGLQLVLGFSAFMRSEQGQNLFGILPVPGAALLIGLIVWAGRDKSGGATKPRGRIMKGPWQ